MAIRHWEDLMTAMQVDKYIVYCIADTFHKVFLFQVTHFVGFLKAEMSKGMKTMEKTFHSPRMLSML